MAIRARFGTEQFNREKWLASEYSPMGSDVARLRMLPDLVRRVLTPGMPRGQVEEFLGSARTCNLFDDVDEGYFCGRDYRGWLSETWLIIVYEKEALSYVEVRTGG